MPLPDIFARPERLQRFRRTAGALSDGLHWRVRALSRSVTDYRLATEAAYEVPCDEVVDVVGALQRAIEDLGEWVGQVGDAFEHLPVAQGVAFLFPEVLLAGVPTLLTEAGGSGAGRRGDAGVDDDELFALENLAVGALAGLRSADRVVPGSGSGSGGAGASGAGGVGRATGRAAARAARHPVIAASQLLAIVVAARAGIAEVAHRWQAEPARDTPERTARAVLDGLLSGGGMLGGGMGGAALAMAACGGPTGPGAACAPIGAAFFSDIGERGGEFLGDLLLGDEPSSWERDPFALADEIADVDVEAITAAAPGLDLVAAEGAEAAGRNADYVISHPWVWDDRYVDAPVHEPPPPAPDVLTSGPR